MPASCKRRPGSGTSTTSTSHPTTSRRGSWSRKETARELGLDFAVAPNQKIEDGIKAVRNIMPRRWFDKTKCDQGMRAPRMYCREWDEKHHAFRDHSLHDWTSHAADAFRYGAVSRPALRGKFANMAMDEILNRRCAEVPAVV